MPDPNPYESDADESDLLRTGSNWVGSLWLVAAVVILGLLFVPAFRRGADGGRRTQCRNNMMQIMVALQNYHEVFGCLPPATTIDDSGRPLHSWRTLILPYLEQETLYQQIDLSVAWNDPVNATVFETAVPVFQCPSTDLASCYTTYQSIVAEDCRLHPTNGRTYADFKDGESNCLVLVEVPLTDAVHWMEPTDHGYDAFLNTRAESGFVHDGNFMTTVLDGSVRAFTSSVPIETRKALMTINGGEDLSGFAY